MKAHPALFEGEGKKIEEYFPEALGRNLGYLWPKTPHFPEERVGRGWGGG